MASLINRIYLDTPLKKLSPIFWLVVWMLPASVRMMNFSLATECTTAGSYWIASAMMVVLFNQVVTTLLDGQNTSSPVKYIL